MPRTDLRFARRPAALLWMLLLSLTCAAQGGGGPAGKTIEELRREYAVGFLDPAPHMALAKYFRDRGNPIQAFYILETARRGRFERKDFDAAFKTHFLGAEPFDASREAEAKLLAEHARDPEAHDTLVKLADIYISREEYAKARQYLDRLVAKHPDDFEDTEALAEVHRREGRKEEAEKLLGEWARKHPETADAYRVRSREVPAAEPAKLLALLTEAVRKFPEDAGFVFDLAAAHQRAGRMKEAEALFVKAARMAPGSSYIQAWVGRFFLKAIKDDARALEHYLRAYLLDPHAYETEYVESRIPALVYRAAEARHKQLLAGGTPLAKILEDPNPVVVQLALERMSTSWEPAHVERLIGLMAHDDGGVRWTAMGLLMKKTDRAFDARLKELLRDADLRRRGLALYVAADHWKAESYDLMRRMLREDAQILRFDAVSALAIDGSPEARRIVIDHARSEPHPRLKRLILSKTAGEKGEPR